MKRLKLLISILVMLALAVNKGRPSIPLKINTLCPVLLLYLVFFLSSHITFAQPVWRKEDVKITGKIKNFEDKQTSMKIIVRDPLSQPFQDIYDVEVDSGGDFSQQISIPCAQEVQLIYDRAYSIFCLPGDSLHIQLKGMGEGEKSRLNFMSGSTAKTNEHISAFLEDQKNKSSPITSKKEIIPGDIADTLFQLWMSDHIKYSSLNQLLEKLNISNAADVLKQAELYRLNDSVAPEVLSLAHAKFLQSYMKFAVSYPQEETNKINQSFKSGKIEEGAFLLKRLIVSNTKGFAREMALSRFFLDGIRGQQLELVDIIYNPGDIKSEYFQDYIKNEYEIQKRYMANQQTGEASLDSLDKSITSDVMSALVSKYKGKVVYIDFWAPWCSPCLAQLPHTKRLQAHYKNKNVTFLFLANRCTDKSWKATIANEKILGEHVNLTDEQYRELANTYKIIGIPRYMLVDRNGQICSPDAPHPENFELITKAIDNLL